MNPEAHERLAGMSRHWWFRGRRAAVAALLRRSGVPAGDVLDFGCGPGHMGRTLSRFGPVTGVDSSAEALAGGDHAAYARRVHACDPAGPAFPSGPFALVSCLDVLEHVEDDAGLLAALAALLAPGGRLIVSVPLHPELFGPSDEVAGHVRRYTPASLHALLDAAGLTAIAETGYVVVLLPVARRRRARVAAGAAKQGVEFSLPPAPANAALSALAVAEGSLARFVSLPPGLSAIVVAERASRMPAGA